MYCVYNICILKKILTSCLVAIFEKKFLNVGSFFLSQLNRVYVYPQWSSNIYVPMFTMLSSFLSPFNLRRLCVINSIESLTKTTKKE